MHPQKEAKDVVASLTQTNTSTKMTRIEGDAFKISKDDSIDSVIEGLKVVGRRENSHVTNIEFDDQKFVLEESVMKTLQDVLVTTILNSNNNNDNPRKWKVIKFHGSFQVHDKVTQKEYDQSSSTMKGRINQLIRYLHMNLDDDFDADTDIKMNGETFKNEGIEYGQPISEITTKCEIIFLKVCSLKQAYVESFLYSSYFFFMTVWLLSHHLFFSL